MIVSMYVDVSGGVIARNRGRGCRAGSVCGFSLKLLELKRMCRCRLKLMLIVPVYKLVLNIEATKDSLSVLHRRHLLFRRHLYLFIRFKQGYQCCCALSVRSMSTNAHNTRAPIRS